MTCPHPDKVKYRSERAARAGVKALRGRRDKGEPLHAYRCGNHWHVGHTDNIWIWRRRKGRR